MIELPTLLINIGLLIATAGATCATIVATAISIWRGVAAHKAERGAVAAQTVAGQHASAAATQAYAAIDAAESARKQAFAAEDSAGSAQRQAAAAERSVLQRDDHRAQDRRAEGIIALAELLIRDADTVIQAMDISIENLRAKLAGEPAPPAPRITQLDRFRNNAFYVRAQAYLAGETPAIANWALMQSDRIYTEGIKTLEATGDPGTKSGAARSLVMRIANDAAKALFAWQRGDLDDEWFIDQVTTA